MLSELSLDSADFHPKSTKDYSPNAINTTIDGVEGYHFSDIISPHPSRKGLWKIVGREDDQIMHSTGEKTNPGPLGESRDFSNGSFHWV